MNAQLLSFTCPHCGRTADVDSASADKILVCPNRDCGKPFQVEIPTAAPAKSQATGRVAEAIPDAGSSLAEQDLHVVHPQTFRRFPFRFGLYVIFFFLGAAGFVYATLTDRFWVSVGCAMVFLFCLLRLVVWKIRNRNTSLTITTLRSVLKAGIFSTQTLEIPHREVREVRVVQDFQAKLFNVGDLIVQGDEKSGKILYLKGVKDAEALASVVRARASDK